MRLCARVSAYELCAVFFMEMEKIVDAVSFEKARAEDFFTSSEKTADPIVYQLVRVDVSGRLVPATDDEVIVVEDFLEEEKTEGRIVLDTEQTPECNTNYGCGSRGVQFKGSEDVQQPADIESGAGNPNASPNLEVGSRKINMQYQKSIPSLVQTANDLVQSGSSEGCSNLAGRLRENESSHSAADTSLKPDFSLLKGEVHLDDLLVRDLQETFRATFGRETSVKDKQWLKRRIIMGLTNSCDFSTTSFVITDNEVVKKCIEETHKSVNHSVFVDSVVQSDGENGESTPTCHDKQNEIHSNANGENIESPSTQDNSGSKDPETEQRPAKRVRKPTRRYIEELSEGDSGECSAKTGSSVRHPTQGQASKIACAIPTPIFGSHGRCLTRKDSLGVSGVQVPYVSRIRRSLPRENYMTLMKIQLSGMSMSPTRLIKNDVASSEQHVNGSVNKSEASLSTRCSQEHPVASPERCKLNTERKGLQLEKEVEMENTDSYKNSSDDEVITVSTANGGIRRKHHRPWTLSEVVKLVEGVAKYGVGRWSEIKRLAFASHAYRTSVDLKDKWRNLLRASVAELPARNGVVQNSRKQTSVPIPAAILLRVRELADIQTQVPPSLSSGKISGKDDTVRSVSVHETRSGFL